LQWQAKEIDMPVGIDPYRRRLSSEQRFLGHADERGQGAPLRNGQQRSAASLENLDHVAPRWAPAD
jgi:hypothetical protein